MAPPPSFIDLPRVALDQLAAARVVVLGAAEASPYCAGQRSHSADAPAALRQASAQFAKSLGQFDFDLDATLFPAKGDYRGCVDAGDVPTHPWDAPGNRARITAAVRSVLAAGAVPVVLGGDDSVPIPVLAAYEGRPLTVLQIDAHVDWADIVQGNPYGYGSTMRRASEYPWVERMVQVGIRGLGSGEAWQHDDARAWGAQLVTAYACHEPGGVAAAAARIAPGSDVFVSIDCDGIDPSVLPAVNMPTPGGLGYEEVVRLLKAVAGRARLAGLALVEYVPARDDRFALSGLVAARIASVAIGLMLGAAAPATSAA